MPAEPTNAKIKRRTSKKDLDDYRFDGSHARELELKRTRGTALPAYPTSYSRSDNPFPAILRNLVDLGEVSCAECRRLKIKCDKNVPCQSCIRRGCVALCPNGSLATGQGTRFVLAATEHLHKRIEKLSGRVRQLEDALSTLQAKYSTEPHPLLHDDLVRLEDQEGDAEMNDEQPATASGGGEIIDSFGTLSISEHGVSRFFGPTGGSESLLSAGSEVSSHDSPESAKTPDSTRDSKSPMSIGELSLFSQSFPFTPLGQPAHIQSLIETNHLPSYDKALEYCATYFKQVSWLFRGVTKAQVVDDMIPAIYNRQVKPGEDYSSPHDLALLFSMFSVAALVGTDPSPQYSDHYYQIARVALSLRPILEKPSMVTIQTLHLLSIYYGLSGNGDQGGESSMETTWSLVTLASHLGQTIGLHRDSARWGLSPKMVQRRRILFWDLFVADSWQSLNTGRPPSLSLAYIDCGLPQYEDGGNLETAFEIWQFRFASEVVADVGARTLTAEAPSYATIMELDRKVRDFPIPESMSKGSSNDFSSSFQRCVLDHIRETGTPRLPLSLFFLGGVKGTPPWTFLLYIHRSFFAQAIIDNPENPLKSAYAPSFLAAYRASSTILKSVQEHFNMWPQSSSTFWTMWTFAFSAAVVFGTVVTRGPRSPLAKSAMRELEQACILFSKASPYSLRATRALPILKKLSEKARYALNAAQSDPSGDNGLHWNIKPEDTDDELSIFAGHARVVNVKRSTETPVSGQRGSQSPSYPAPPVASTASSSSSSTCQIRQPQPVYTTERVLPHETSMDTAEPVWSGPTPSYPQAIPTDESTLQYGYHTSAPETVATAAPPLANQYPWTDGPRDMASRYARSTSHHTGTRISRPSMGDMHTSNPQSDRSYYSSSSLSSVPPNFPGPYYHSDSREYHQAYGPTTPAMVSPLASTSPSNGTPLFHQPQRGHPSHRAQHIHEQGRPHPGSSGSANPTRTYSSEHAAYPMYSTTPAFHAHSGAPANPALADLGFASRDSRLDEKWSMFMSDSGILEGTGYPQAQ